MRLSTTALFLSVAAAAACSHDPTTAITPTPIAATSTSAPAASNDGDAFTLAVIGDTPYGAAKLAEFPALVDLINADPNVRAVVHLGDIKSGKNSPCTDEYFATIRALFDRFADPFVYTPGDNEWTDCHAAGKNNGLYTPTERLAKVRELFFPVAGRTLGIRSMEVKTEASDPANSPYVENVQFRERRVVFATVNIPGSNNDGVSWGTLLPADASSYPSQAEERAARAQANEAWINEAFATATRTQAAGVVLAFQADMWDTTEPALDGFDALVQQIGTLAARFGKPVLLLEGDSHKFKVDNPFSASSPLHAVHPATPVAENVTRIVVEGSDAGRTEYLRLVVEPSPRAASLFSWERVSLH